jgi:hypothetical protein
LRSIKDVESASVEIRVPLPYPVPLPHGIRYKWVSYGRILWGTVSPGDCGVGFFLRTTVIKPDKRNNENAEIHNEFKNRLHHVNWKASTASGEEVYYLPPGFLGLRINHVNL